MQNASSEYYGTLSNIDCMSVSREKLEVLSFNPRNEEISASNLTWMGGRGVKPIPCN